MRTSRAPRVARGAVAATISTFVALAWHVAAGGAMPGALGVAVPWVLSLAVCTLLAGRHLSLTRLTLAVGASQALFHTLFVLGAVSPASASVTNGAHAAHGAAMTFTTTATASAHSHVDLAMLLGHVIAAMITTAVLYRGEALVRALLEIAQGARTRMRVRLGLETLLPVSPARTMPNDTHHRTPLLLGTVVTPPPRRGPPLSFAI